MLSKVLGVDLTDRKSQSQSEQPKRESIISQKTNQNFVRLQLKHVLNKEPAIAEFLTPRSSLTTDR